MVTPANTPLKVVVPESTAEALVAAGVPVSSLFHRVGSVTPEAQQIVYAAPDEPVGRVLEVMGRHGFSQVPLRAREGAEVRGVFSYRSFTQRVASSLKLRGEIVEWPVEALAEDPRPFVDPTEELVEIFGVLDAREF